MADTSLNIAAQNTFTGWVAGNGHSKNGWSVSMVGSSANLTVTIQGRKRGATEVVDLHTESNPAATGVMKNIELYGDWEVRAGVKTGELTGGSVIVSIARGQG